MGREALIAEHYVDGEKRAQNIEVFQDIFLTKTAEEWIEYLGQWDVCVSKVNNIDELADDPQIRYRNMILELDHPKFGKVKHPGISIKLSETPGSVRRFGPNPGEHTEEVLLDLGYSKVRIEELRKDGVLG